MAGQVKGLSIESINRIRCRPLQARLPCSPCERAGPWHYAAITSPVTVARTHGDHGPLRPHPGRLDRGVLRGGAPPGDPGGGSPGLGRHPHRERPHGTFAGRRITCLRANDPAGRRRRSRWRTTSRRDSVDGVLIEPGSRDFSSTNGPPPAAGGAGRPGGRESSLSPQAHENLLRQSPLRSSSKHVPGTHERVEALVPRGGPVARTFTGTPKAVGSILERARPTTRPDPGPRTACADGPGVRVTTARSASSPTEPGNGADRGGGPVLLPTIR